MVASTIRTATAKRPPSYLRTLLRASIFLLLGVLPEAAVGRAARKANPLGPDQKPGANAAVGRATGKANPVSPDQEPDTLAGRIEEHRQSLLKALQLAEAVHASMDRSASPLTRRTDGQNRSNSLRATAQLAERYNQAAEDVTDSLRALEEVMDEESDPEEAEAVRTASAKAQQAVRNAEFWLAVHPKLDEDELEQMQE